MQKVTAFLERYVEWVAVALGAAFLLFMVFIYVIGTPISAKLGTTNVTLSNVETTVYDQAGHNLELAMSDTKVPSATMEAYASDFRNYMAMKDVPLPQLAEGGWGSGSPEKPLPKGPEKEGTEKGPGAKVQGLPGPLPEPKFYAASEGRSNVQTDPAAAPAIGGGAAFGPMGPMGAMGPMGPMGPMGGIAAANDDAQPAAPAAGARASAKRPVAAAGVAAAGPAKPGGTDKIWVTEAFTIPAAGIVTAFDNAKIPNNEKTVFLRVDVIRQEQMPDGSWGNETQIAPLAYHQVPAYPKQGEGIAERTYNEWASQNAQTILTPSFYPKVAGDTWFAPGQPNPNKTAAAVVKPVINPIPVQPRIPGMRGGRTGGMGPMGPAGGGMRGGRTGGRSYAPDDPERPRSPFMQGMPPEAIRAMQEGMARGQQMAAQAQAAARGGVGAAGPGGFPPGAVPGVGEAAVSVPDGFTVPSGSFAPADLNADIFGWFHDDTVEPGRTYRYKVAYKLRNPLYGNVRLAANAQLAAVFAIQSPMSEWSDPVTVDPVTRFYVAAGVPQGASSVRFDVYRWQDGKWQTKQFTAAPGDEIGANDAGINYDTGWALADLDSSVMSREPVIIANAIGKLDSRSFPIDQGAEGEFKKEIGMEKPAAPVAPGAGFMPPGMGGPAGGFVPPPGAGGPPAGFVPPPANRR